MEPGGQEVLPATVSGMVWKASIHLDEISPMLRLARSGVEGNYSLLVAYCLPKGSGAGPQGKVGASTIR